MSRPPINPQRTAAGIALDPQTLERVIPESRRPDGTVRKQIKIRPGFTPQEDVRRFRGTKQAQMDANQLPKGHIIGWAPLPTSSAASGSTGDKPLSKSAKKNLKRKEKREREKEEVPENWDDDDEPKATTATANKKMEDNKVKESAKSETPVTDAKKNTATTSDSTTDLADKLEKLDVK